MDCGPSERSYTLRLWSAALRIDRPLVWGALVVELRTVNGRLKPRAAFKLVATGWLLGGGAIFVPAFTLATLGSLATGAPAVWNGQVVEGASAVFVRFMPLVLVPLILAMQSVMIGGLVVLGLWLYQKRRPIRVVGEDAADETAPMR